MGPGAGPGHLEPKARLGVHGRAQPGAADIDLTPLALGLIDRVKEQPYRTTTRAISWVLRELGKEHPGEVAACLEENVDLLPKHVLQEVTNKLTTGRKK